MILRTEGLLHSRRRRLLLWTIIICGLLDILIISVFVISAVQTAALHRDYAEAASDAVSAIDGAADAEAERLHKGELTSTGHELTVSDGVTSIDGIVIANKTYSLPENYGSGLTAETQDAFDTMKAAAASDSISLSIASGFRSYDTQSELYASYVSRYGKEEADTFSARPGYSEHQIGEAMDLNLVSQSFADTEAYRWLQLHAAEYGFILRYPSDAQAVTGYIGEPWHYRYVGKDLASKLYNGGDWIPLETYFGIDSSYSD